MAPADLPTWQLSARQLVIPVGTANPQHEQVSTSGTLATRIPPVARSHGNNNKGRSELSGQSGYRRNNSIYYRIGSTGWGMGIAGLYLVPCTTQVDNPPQQQHHQPPTVWQHGLCICPRPTAPLSRAWCVGLPLEKPASMTDTQAHAVARAASASCCSCLTLGVGIVQVPRPSWPAFTSFTVTNTRYNCNTRLCPPSLAHHLPTTQLDMVDLWSDHSPWPHNTVPQSYSFLVKYPFLWWLSYTLTQPRFVHRTISLVTGWQVGHRVAMVRGSGGMLSWDQGFMGVGTLRCTLRLPCLTSATHC